MFIYPLRIFGFAEGVPPADGEIALPAFLQEIFQIGPLPPDAAVGLGQKTGGNVAEIPRRHREDHLGAAILRQLGIGLKVVADLGQQAADVDGVGGGKRHARPVGQMQAADLCERLLDTALAVVKIAPDGGDMYDFITATLPRFGYRRYEISNFARAGFESRHNLGYWTGKKYLGVGAGAHGYDGKIRTSNISDVAAYIKKIRAGGDVSELEEIVTRQAAMEEFCFLGLRMTAGISAKIFRERFSKDIFDVYGAVIEKNLKLGLLEIDGDKIFLTDRGMKIGNVVFADFLLLDT